MSVNKFVLNETSYFGKGAREELPEEITSIGDRCFRDGKHFKELINKGKKIAEVIGRDM